MGAILTLQTISVSDSGELVVLRVGDFAATLEFQDALQLSCAMRLAARQAKAAAGDDASRKNMFGVLTDANAPKPRLQRFRMRLPERLAAKNLAARAVGTKVEVRFGRVTLTLGHKDAAEKAQWLRTHAKAARNFANERAHWAQLVNDHGMVEA